ncbi:TorF family putative porin [Oxalobacteraceae bacterium OTU3CAMAD1]|nr:TorF family putative porin [Oxalobacteraceae bacterium OTU3CAMAD1]
MKSTNLTLIAALTIAFATMSASAQAQDAQPAAAAVPDNQISYNIAVTSDYRYRGISQTRLNPALQGGVDYVNNPTGLYVGTWASSIKWVKDGGGDANIEVDVYAGKRGEITKDFTYDVGGLYYIYPSNGLTPSANTFELYAQVGTGPFSLKYSHSTTNLFGFADSKNSGYVDAQFNQDVYDGYILNLHAGHQKVKNNSASSYSDYKVGFTKDFGVATVALAAVFTNTDTYVGRGKNLGKTGAVLTISKTF